MFGDMIREMELHEAAEWFKLDGANVVDPHPVRYTTGML